MKASLLGEIQEGDVSVVESRLHFPPFSHILYKPHLNKPKSTYHNNDLRSRQRWSGVGRWRKHRSPDLVLEGHDRVVLGGVDVQDVVVVLPAQVVGDVGEGSAGCLGHPVVDDDHVILAVGQRCGWVPLPQAVLRVPLLDLSYLVSGDGSFWGDERKLEKGEFKMQKLDFFFFKWELPERKDFFKKSFGELLITQAPGEAVLKLNLTFDLPVKQNNSRNVSVKKVQLIC